MHYFYSMLYTIAQVAGPLHAIARHVSFAQITCAILVLYLFSFNF